MTAHPVAGTEGASGVFWSPTGKSVGFFADTKLKRVDLSGGAPLVLADAPLGRGAAWSRDDIILFAPTTTAGLSRVAATGGPVTVVTKPVNGQGSHRWPQFLPGGRRVIFLVTLGQPDTHGTYVVSLDGGEPTRVLAGETAAVYAPPGYLLWASQGVLVAQRFDATRATLEGEPVPVTQVLGIDDGTFRSAFSVSAMGTLAHRVGTPARRQLVWVDRTGKVLNALGAPDDNVLANPALAPDGQRVAVSRIVEGNFDVWLMNVGRGVASRFTFNPALDSTPIWSPDGRRLAFGSARKVVGDLYEKPTDGATDEQPLLVNTQEKWLYDWSRDGRFILYGVFADPKTTGGDLWTLPLTGDRTPFPVAQTSFEEFGGQFSPDGRWLAYASNESGRAEIYVRPFPSPGGKWQVSTAGGNQPRWRRDGKELFYVAPDNRLMAVPLGLAADTSAVVVGEPMVLFPTRLASGAGIGPPGSIFAAQYDVATDGRFLMNVAVEEATAPPITIVQNWLAALKK
jgi:Tol biopolymer transport system component